MDERKFASAIACVRTFWSVKVWFADVSPPRILRGPYHLLPDIEFSIRGTPCWSNHKAKTGWSWSIYLGMKSVEITLFLSEWNCFLQILEGVEHVVANEIIKHAVQEAQYRLDRCVAYFVHTYPHETSSADRKAQLMRYDEIVSGQILPKLWQEDCFNGTTWAPFVTAAALHIWMLDEEGRLANTTL